MEMHNLFLACTRVELREREKSREMVVRERRDRRGSMPGCGWEAARSLVEAHRPGVVLTHHGPQLRVYIAQEPFTTIQWPWRALC